jgi:hypothetical protein
MAAFNKVNSFVEALAEKVHNLGSDQLKIALTNTAPTAATTNYAGLTSPLAATNLDGANPFNVTTSTSAQTSGTYKLVCADLVLTATGAVGPFRYVALYNDTAAADEVIGWYDYGSSISLANGETFTVDFDGANGVLTIA